MTYQSFAPTVFAEKTVDFMQSSIEELMQIEVERVTGASRYEQRITEAPSSISIVSAEDIRHYGYRNVADILRSIRGFYISYDRSYSYLGARGFSRPGDYNTRVLLLLNGHRLNDNIYDSAALDSDFILDVDLIDRIELIRGPGSSLYGTSAFFAIINVITKKGQALQGAEISAEAGSSQTYKGRLSYGHVFQNGASVFASGTRLDSAGNRRLFFSEFDDPATNNGIAEHADYEKASNYYTEASFGKFSVTGGYGYRQKGIPTASFETKFNTQKTFTADEHAFLELKYEHSFDLLTALTARASYDQYYYYGHYLYEPSLLNKDFARGKWAGGELQLTSTAFDRHKVIIGAEFRHNFQQHQGNYDTSVYLDDKRHSSTLALYLQDEFSITGDIMLNAGMRYDHSQAFGGELNPRLALIYHPAKGTFLKYLFGTAFRAPNVYERYYEDGGLTQKGNPDLKPEKIVTHEAVIEQYFSNNLRGTASVYHYRIRDLISQQIDPSDSLSVFRNTEEISASGIEVEMKKSLRNGASGTVSYAYQKAKDSKTGDTLTNSPKHLARMNLLIPLIGKTVSTGTELQYASTRLTLSGGHVASYLIANLSLFGKNVQKGLDLSAGLYNVFNKKYRDPAGTDHQPVIDAIAQNGRNFRFKATYAF